MEIDWRFDRARNDFDQARKDAALRDVLARLRGRPSDLLSFDSIQSRFEGVQHAEPGVRDIPLSAVVGSVGRYADFNRDFLPRAAHDRERWARVKVAMESGFGLPPIDVYRVGEVYFVIDGNHRVSIARQRGDETIQARVTEIRTRVAIEPGDRAEEILLKAEYNEFLEHTRFDDSFPEADLRTTEPGKHLALLQQIEAVAFKESMARGVEVGLPEAVRTWYADHYLPALEAIRSRNLLRRYPDRTETDLYAWLMENHLAVSEELGWDVRVDAVAAELADRKRAAAGLRGRIAQVIDPEAATGEWRERQVQAARGRMFGDVLVLVGEPGAENPSLDHALMIAGREGAHLLGLAILAEGERPGSRLRRDFEERCIRAGVTGQLAFGRGGLEAVVGARARWADLLVIPAFSGAEARHRLSHVVETIGIPVWAARGAPPASLHTLLAFDGSPKANEALFMAAYLAGLWGVSLSVHAVLEPGVKAGCLDDAKDYLEAFGIEARFHAGGPPAPERLLAAAVEESAGLVILGGHHASRFGRHGHGRIVAHLLEHAPMSLLICR